MRNQNIHCNQNGSQNCDLISTSNAQMYQQELLNYQFNQISYPNMYDQNTNRIQQGVNGQNLNMNAYPGFQGANDQNNNNNYVKQNHNNVQHQVNTYDLDMPCNRTTSQKTNGAYDSNQNKTRTAQRYVPSSKPDTFGYKISKESNKHIYWVSDTPGYHTKRCCFLFWADDCFLKWIADLLFYIFFFPFKVMGLIITWITRICCKGNNCLIQIVQLIEEIAYSPVACFGSWVNQCWYSTKMFCCQCKSVDFIGNSDGIDNCCQLCFLSSGQCVKSCCSFDIDCKCCKALDCNKLCQNQDGECCFSYYCIQCGDCLQNVLTPQGMCENCCKSIQDYSCDCINSKCMESVCCCCIKVKEIGSGDALATITNCCCCVINTLGSIQL